MKKITILIAIFVITITNLSAQDLIDPIVIPTHPDTTIDFNNTNIFAKNIPGFTLGWNYGMAGRQLDTLMKTNMYLHGWSQGDTLNWTNRGNNHNWYLSIYPLNQLSDVGIVCTQAMYYEPSITVNRNDNFTPGPNNIEGAVFGFQYKHPNITNSGGKAVINTNVVTSLPVLSDVWPKNELKFWNGYYLCYHNLRDEL